MTTIPFNTRFSCEYGQAEILSPLVRRIVARNPGPFTFYGTGTYLVGRGNVAVIDPGPDDPEHIGAILNALRGEQVSHILVTHTHRDHSPGCALLQQHVTALSYGFGPHGSGRVMRDVVVEEGADLAFDPQVRVQHGMRLQGDGWSVECVHTPGHTSNHVCYQLREEKALFCGDHVMAWSTSIISPPDGDLARYLDSLKLLLKRDDKIFWPCHGPGIPDPQSFVQAYIAHREARIEQVLECLQRDQGYIRDMVSVMYADLAPSMHPAAALSVLSCLIYLIDKGRVTSHTIGLDSEYKLTDRSV